MAVALTPYGSPLPAGASLRSMLLIECGSAWTHATLLGMAEGHCRLLSRASAPTTHADIIGGMYEAARQVERVTGRKLFAQGRTLSPETDAGDGVDGVGLVLSAGGPLHMLVLGPGLDVWGTGVRRALATAAVAPVLAPGLAPEAYPMFQAEPLHMPMSQPVQMVLLLGPGPAAMAQPQARAALESAAHQALQLTGFMTERMRPMAFVVVGSAEEQAVARQVLGGVDIIGVEPQSPSHPGSLTMALGQIYEQIVLQSVAGFGRVRSWAST